MQNTSRRWCSHFQEQLSHSRWCRQQAHRPETSNLNQKIVGRWQWLGRCQLPYYFEMERSNIQSLVQSTLRTLKIIIILNPLIFSSSCIYFCSFQSFSKKFSFKSQIKWRTKWSGGKMYERKSISLAWPSRNRKDDYCLLSHHWSSEKRLQSACLWPFQHFCWQHRLRTIRKSKLRENRKPCPYNR